MLFPSLFWSIFASFSLLFWFLKFWSTRISILFPAAAGCCSQQESADKPTATCPAQKKRRSHKLATIAGKRIAAFHCCNVDRNVPLLMLSQLSWHRPCKLHYFAHDDLSQLICSSQVVAYYLPCIHSSLGPFSCFFPLPYKLNSQFYIAFKSRSMLYYIIWV